MTLRKNIKLIGIFLCLTLSGLNANYTGFPSLLITPSARENALAGTGVACAYGPQAMFINPALTSELNRTAVSFSYTNWFLDMYQQSLFAVRPLPIINLGLGITNFNHGELELRPNQPTETEIGKFSPSDFSFFLNLSRKLDERVLLGISGRYYYEKILEHTATGYGIDIGLLFKVWPRFHIGFSVINFGRTMYFIRDEFWLPTRFLTGINYDFTLKPNIKIALGSDFSYFVYDKRLEFNSGVEMQIFQQYFIRAGYNFADLIDRRTKSTPSSISMGFGVIIKKIRLEYAFTPYSDGLDDTHHFSIGFGY
ncbi:MAG: PorV/PorQ family protein [candidate division WOR-3 bacterium]|nr:PorV/PorQ family protein [candidate division WOR-3 bacterium]